LPRVLLIEHSTTIRHIEKNLLIRAGYEVEVEFDYPSALKRIRTGASDGSGFNAVLLGWSDHVSPGKDELYDYLHQPNILSLPIIIFNHESEPALAAMAKLRPNAVFLLWEEYLRTPDVLALLLGLTKEKHRKPTGGASSLQPIRVLFVDDSITVRHKYRRLLTANGYDAETAGSVEEGFEKALENNFDIAIVDYFMPGATGDILCQRLREHPTTASITTAIITASYLDKAIKNSLEAGAVECMFKNESDDLFLTRIDAMSRHIRAHKSITKERERLGGILRSVGDGVYGVDTDGRISFINPACRRILGYDLDEPLIGQSALELFHYADQEGQPIDEVQCFLQRTYEKSESIQGWETLFWHKSGAAIPVECTVYPLTINDRCEGSVVAFRDISERKLLEEELRWQATHDALTKIYNRRYFEEQLKNETGRLKRSNEICALLYIDLDRFKYINDTAGHVAGDQLLIEIAHKMTQRQRKTDMVARLGGDEFAIILRNVNVATVHQVAEGYREMLDHYMFSYNGKQYKVNGTIGIALIDKNSESASDVLANADIACHIAKGEGRNRTHLFIPENDSKQAMDQDLGWFSRLHNALENDHLLLHYQPIIPLAHIPADLMNCGDGPIVEKLLEFVPQETQVNEVLLRLSDPTWGVVYPGAFLPTAERFNMMDKVDGWVVAAAFKKLATLQASGFQGSFSINLSGQTIGNTNLITVIEELIEKLQLDSSKVIFEITETSAVSNLISAHELITRLKALGCRFALDDFGSGFSSFSHLKHLPVDFIKIDGLFVRGVTSDPSDRAIVHSINDIAHSLGKETIAEYVENAEILQFLIETGVDYVQGHYISCSDDFSRLYPLMDRSGSLSPDTPSVGDRFETHRPRLIT
jgi:diguanylate cyclase (GGDEF)-like protein/PAS domain S-box-containing protein